MAMADLSIANDTDDAVSYRYFIAAPMSGLPADEYPPFRDWVMSLVNELETADAPVYFAGRTIASSAQFSTSAYAATHDLKALKASEEFVLVYPTKCHSSAIFEAGIAIGLGLKVTILTPNRSELVFMLQSPEVYGALNWSPGVKIIEYGSQLPAVSEVAAAL